MAKEEVIPIKEEKEPQKQSPESLEQEDLGTQTALTEDTSVRRLLPKNVPNVGRSAKLRDVYVSSGAIAASSAVVTVTAADGGAQTDMKSFKFFPDEWHVGMVVRITAIGTYTSDGTRTCTLRIGSGLAPTTEWNSITSTAASTTNQPWNLIWYGIVTAIGSSGTLEAQLTGSINNVSKNDANSATVSIDTTASITVALTADWDGTDANNTFTVRQWIVEILY